MLSDVERQFLSVEFESLKQDALDMNNDTFQGRYLYDDIAASVKEDIDFGAGLSENTPKTYENFSGSWDAWEVTKDVKFTSGVMTIDVNSGGAEERYLLKQGSNTIFDSGAWGTKGSAKNYDFDRFIVEYSPSTETTFEFVPMSDGNSSNTDLDGSDNIKGNSDDETLPTDSTYHNKSKYLGNLGLTDDGNGNTGMDALLGQKFTNKGNVTTNQANASTTNLTLRIESKTWFQIVASYSVPTTSSNYITVGDAENGYAVLDPVGLGLLQNMSISTVSDAASAVDKVAKEIEGLGSQMATIGANLSELKLATERTSQQVAAGQRGLSRITDGKMAEESVQLAKERMRTQSNLSLMTQARGLRKNLYDVLME